MIPLTFFLKNKLMKGWGFSIKDVFKKIIINILVFFLKKRFVISLKLQKNSF